MISDKINFDRADEFNAKDRKTTKIDPDIKSIIENYVRKTKNKNFRFDEAIDSSVLFSFTLEKIFALLRGFRFLDSYHF